MRQYKEIKQRLGFLSYGNTNVIVHRKITQHAESGVVIAIASATYQRKKGTSCRANVCQPARSADHAEPKSLV